MSQMVTALMSYGLDFLSAQPIAARLNSYDAVRQAEEFDKFITSIERWDNINL